MGIDVKQIKQFAAYVDKKANGGNGNGYVDGSEISIFKSKVKTVDRELDIDSILDTYNKNKVTEEANYDKNAQKPATVEEAIIAAFNPKSALNKAEAAENQAKTITEGIKNNDKFSNSTDLITKDNVLDVVANEEALKKIVDSKDSVRKDAGTKIIDALVEAASERQVDVSHIVFKNDKGEYVVGRDVKNGENDVPYGSSAFDKSNMTAVINALKAEIEKGKETAVGNNEDKDAVLTMLAKRIDADSTVGGNKNGFIDTAKEISAFKQAAATHGFDINAVLQEIRDNEADGVENTTNLQKTVFNIFDPTQKAEKEKEVENKAKDLAKSFKDGAAFKNNETLKASIDMLSSENIMIVLNEYPDLVSKAVSKSENHATKILDAIIAFANENGINVDDLVMKSNDKYIAGGNVEGVIPGSVATTLLNSTKVVKAIQDRINESLKEE